MDQAESSPVVAGHRASRRKMLTGAAIGAAGLAGGVLAYPRAASAATVSPTYLAPSGDTSGATDVANINAYFSSGADVALYLISGVYYINEPIIMNYDQQSLRGVQYGYTTSIVSTATSPQTAMIIAGNTQVIEQCDIRDLALYGAYSASNTNSGHGIAAAIEAGTIQNVAVQDVSGDAFHFENNINTNYLDSMVMINCYGVTPGGCGLYIDKYLTSSEFFACHFAGGVTSLGGTYGMHVLGGGMKFIACHPFGFTNYGLYLDNAREIQVIGGEYESNGVRNIVIINSSTNCRISGISSYFSTAFGTPTIVSDILVENSTAIDIESCNLAAGGSGSGIEFSGAPNSSAAGNRILASPYNGDIPPHGILNDAGAGVSNYLSIRDNYITGQGTGNSAIAVGGGQHCSVRGNKIFTADFIAEGTGGNYNIFTDNDAYAYGTGGVHIVGANTISANNIT
jgi:hypothetical protein